MKSRVLVSLQAYRSSYHHISHRLSDLGPTTVPDESLKQDDEHTEEGAVAHPDPSTLAVSPHEAELNPHLEEYLEPSLSNTDASFSAVKADATADSELPLVSSDAPSVEPLAESHVAEDNDNEGRAGSSRSPTPTLRSPSQGTSRERSVI